MLTLSAIILEFVTGDTQFDWSQKAEFNAAEEKDWNNGAGLDWAGLPIDLIFWEKSAMPADQPENALTMITTFLNGEAFREHTYRVVL